MGLAHRAIVLDQVWIQPHVMLLQLSHDVDQVVEF